MRVLPQVEGAEFDIPSETFTLQTSAGADTAPILAAIRNLGYEPEILDATPEKADRIEQLRNPTSARLREALARAKARQVPLVLDFGGPFCRLSKRFEATTLADDRVIARLSSYELLQVDVEEDPDATKDLDVHGVPDLWVLDGTGKVLARHNGYLAPDAFLAFLEAAGR